MLQTLEQVWFLEDIPPEGVHLVATQGDIRVFPTGSYLMRQGEAGDSMHILLEGRVLIERSHPHLLDPIVLTELIPGDLVGEVGVLDGDPRSASVKAVEHTTTLELSCMALAHILRQYPVLSARLLKVLSRRARIAAEPAAAAPTGDHREQAPSL